MVTGSGDCPAVFVVVLYDQSVLFSAVPEFAVMVCTTTGTILDAIDIVVIVHHLMQQRGGNFFNGSGKGTGSDVDLVCLAVFTDPGVFPEGKVAECLRG